MSRTVKKVERTERDKEMRRAETETERDERIKGWIDEKNKEIEEIRDRTKILDISREGLNVKGDVNVEGSIKVNNKELTQFNGYLGAKSLWWDEGTGMNSWHDFKDNKWIGIYGGQVKIMGQLVIPQTIEFIDEDAFNEKLNGVISSERNKRTNETSIIIDTDSLNIKDTKRRSGEGLLSLSTSGMSFFKETERKGKNGEGEGKNEGKNERKRNDTLRIVSDGHIEISTKSSGEERKGKNGSGERGNVTISGKKVIIQSDDEVTILGNFTCSGYQKIINPIAGGEEQLTGKMFDGKLIYARLFKGNIQCEKEIIDTTILPVSKDGEEVDHVLSCLGYCQLGSGDEVNVLVSPVLELDVLVKMGLGMAWVLKEKGDIVFHSMSPVSDRDGVRSSEYCISIEYTKKPLSAEPPRAQSPGYQA